MSAGTGQSVQQNGAIAGAAAYVAGIVLTLLIGFAGLSGAFSLFVGFAPVVGTVSLYSMLHLWPHILGGTGLGSILVWTLLPVVVLVAAGYWVASTNDGGFTEGASVAIGYFVLSVIGFLVLLVMGNSSGGSATGDILAIGLGLLFTGIVFPVVFGGIGGLIAENA